MRLLKARLMRAHVMTSLVLLAALGASFPAEARSSFLENLGQGMVRKADEKYQSRWTLADWFETQRKTRLQDMWLAGNRGEDIYDFGFGGSFGTVSIFSNGSTTKSDEVEGRSAYVLAYATLVGIEARYWDFAHSQAGSPEAEHGWRVALAVRLIGDSQQNTNLTLYGGSSYVQDGTGDIARAPFAGARATLYLTRAFGIDAAYDYRFATTTDLGAELEGRRLEAGVFLDFAFLRLFGVGTWDSRVRKFQAISTERNRESIDGGLKLFF